MAKIVQYQPNQVQTQVAAKPQAQNVSSAAFGGDIAEGFAAVAKISFDIKQRVDTTSAEEALVNFEREKNKVFFDPDNGYFNTQGRNAYDKSTETTEALNKLKRDYGDKLNPQARMMFDSVADKHITKSNVDIARHASKGLKAWEVATVESQVENTLENASLYWRDSLGPLKKDDQGRIIPTDLDVQLKLGQDHVRQAAQMQGLGPEATAEKLQTYNSSFAGATIAAALQSSAAEGKAAYEKLQTKLEGPDKVKVQTAIEKKEKSEKTQADANAAVLTAGRLVNQYDNREDIINEINKIKDPELRKKTQTETMVQFNQKKTAEKETAAKHYDTAIDFVNRGGTPMQFQSANPEAWEGMTSKQQNNLLAGKHMTTDQVRFNSVLSLPRSELAKVDPTDYADIFKPSDVSKLRSAVDKAKKGQSVTSIQTPAKKIKLVAEQFFGKEKTWANNKTKSAKVQALMNDAQGIIEAAEEDKGGKLTPSELDKVLSTYSREFAAERSAFGFDWLASDLNINLKNAEPEQITELGKLTDRLGDTAVKETVDFLESKDQPVTVENIIKVMRKAKVTK